MARSHHGVSVLSFLLEVESYNHKELNSVTASELGRGLQASDRKPHQPCEILTLKNYDIISLFCLKPLFTVIESMAQQ